MKKLYLVSRKVLANSIKEAISTRGEIFEILLADDKHQPQQVKKEAGFVAKKKK